MPGAFAEIDDIEDLISSQDITPKERYASRKNVNVRSRKREDKKEEPVEKIILESVVPGNITLKLVILPCLFCNYVLIYKAGVICSVFIIIFY